MRGFICLYIKNGIEYSFSFITFINVLLVWFILSRVSAWNVLLSMLRCVCKIIGNCKENLHLKILFTSFPLKSGKRSECRYINRLITFPQQIVWTLFLLFTRLIIMQCKFMLAPPLCWGDARLVLAWPDGFSWSKAKPHSLTQIYWARCRYPTPYRFSVKWTCERNRSIFVFIMP